MNQPQENERWKHWFNQLKELGPVSPRPYFYGRLQARMEAGMQQANTPIYLPWWLRRPAYALALLGVLAALNLATALTETKQHETAAEPVASTYESFLTEYQLEQQPVYADE